MLVVLAFPGVGWEASFASAHCLVYFKKHISYLQIIIFTICMGILPAYMLVLRACLVPGEGVGVLGTVHYISC